MALLPRCPHTPRLNLYLLQQVPPYEATAIALHLRHDFCGECATIMLSHPDLVDLIQFANGLVGKLLDAEITAHLETGCAYCTQQLARIQRRPRPQPATVT